MKNLVILIVGLLRAGAALDYWRLILIIDYNGN